MVADGLRCDQQIVGTDRFSCGLQFFAQFSGGFGVVFAERDDIDGARKKDAQTFRILLGSLAVDNAIPKFK